MVVEIGREVRGPEPKPVIVVEDKLDYEIDFLPIGDKTCGDSIVLRFGDLASGDRSRQCVILVDGGYAESLGTITDHFNLHVGTDRIDLVVSGHQDRDHAGGLPGVINTLQVGALAMHAPWLHSAEIARNRGNRFTTAGLDRKIQASLQDVSDLAAAADARGVPIYEPFVGEFSYPTPWGTLTILGPTRAYYEELLPQILGYKQSLPSKLLELALSENSLIGKAVDKLEDHDIETLTDAGTTSPQNNASVIMLLTLNDAKQTKILLTGDAGMPALELAYLQYQALGLGPGDLHYAQVPHHGGRQNVGPTILTKFLGPITPAKDQFRGNAIVSAVAACDVHGHPKKSATNAFRRRGYPVAHTAGRTLLVSSGRDGRGWGPVDPLPLYSLVEADADE